MTDTVAENLLDALRTRLGQPDLAYVDAPVKLTGGFYTDNRAFRLDARDPSWAVPLVVRLFPREAPPDLPRREAATQRVLTEHGFPTARVLWFEDDRGVLGRAFLVMEKLEGRAPMGGNDLVSILRSVPFLLGRMPRVIAQVMAQLHAVDPEPLVEAMPDIPAGIERWLETLDMRGASDAPELAPAAQWLRANRPPEPRRAICHGDLWAGNLLVERRKVTGVLDWSVVTVADPALDVGFASMSLTIAPVDVGAPGGRLERLVVRNGQWIAGRLVRAYERISGADLKHLRYYEALRVPLELSNVIVYRRAQAEGREIDIPRPTWDRATDRMLDYFEARTGVRLTLPPPAGP